MTLRGATTPDPSRFLCNGNECIAERKNFKLLFCAGIALAVGVRIYIFQPIRMTDAILLGSPPQRNMKRSH